VTVRCPGCTRNKRGCSLRYYNFGIGTAPTLIKTKAGDLRRAEQVAAKQKGGSKKAILVEDDSPMLGTSAMTTRAAAKGKRGMVMAPAIRKSISEGLPSQSGSILGEEDQAESMMRTSPEPGPLTERLHLPAPWIRPNGRSERMFFEDIFRFEKELVSPSRTAGKLGFASAEVKSIVERERTQVSTLSSFTENRRPVMEALIKRLDAEAARLSGVVGEDFAGDVAGSAEEVAKSKEKEPGGVEKEDAEGAEKNDGEGEAME